MMPSPGTWVHAVHTVHISANSVVSSYVIPCFFQAQKQVD